jgi:dolichol-phosphate mannosyltransferase
VRFSVVIPARDEGGTIGPTLTALGQRLDQDGLDYEIVVVDDGSTDATVAEVSACRAVNPRIRLVRNE